MSTQPEALQWWAGDERFDARSILGRGANGLVLRALDRRTGDEVAIKLLRRRSASALRRMRAEFDSIASVAHRNLVAFYELDARRDPWLLVMELIDGAPLLATGAAPASRTRATLTERAFERDAIDDAVEEEDIAASPRRCSLVDVAGRFTELCDGLEALHARGVLHLDLKPANVLLERGSERVVIVDLGLAHRHADASFSLAGTPAYLSPELLAHRTPTDAADRYALGVMLFEALAHKWPFGGSAAQILAQKRVERAPSLRDVAGSAAPAALVTLCDALLDRDPSARPSLDDTRAALAPYCAPGQRRARGERAAAQPTPRIELGSSDGRGLSATLYSSESARDRDATLAAVATALVREGSLVVHARCDRDARVRYALLDRLARGCAAIERDHALIDAVDALVTGTLEELSALSRATESLTAAIDRISARAPLAFVISEAHEADLESIAFASPLALRLRARTRWFFAAHPADALLEPLRATLGSAPSITLVERAIAEERAGGDEALVAGRSAIEREVLSLLACARGPLAVQALLGAMTHATGFRRAVRSLQLAGLVVRAGASRDDEGTLALAYGRLARPLLDRRDRRWNEARLLRELARSGADPLALARVLEALGHREGALHEYERVSRARSDEGRFVEARASARAAARLADERSERSRLEEWTATLDEASGHASSAADAFARAAVFARDPGRRRALTMRSAEQLLIAGRYSEGRRALDEVARACGGPLASVRAAIAHALGIERRIEVAPDARERLEAGLIFVAGVGMVDPLRALVAHRENVRLAESIGDERSRVAVLEMQLLFDGAIGAPRAQAVRDGAERVAERCSALHAKATDERERRAWLAAEHRARGVSAIQLGRFREGVSALDRAEAIQLPSDPWCWRRTVAEHFRLWGLYYLGAFAALADAAPARSWRAQRSGDRYASLDFRTQHAICAWLVADDGERASAQLDAAHAAFADESGPMQQRDVVVAKVELELYRGAPQRAFELLRSTLGLSPAADALIPEGMRVDALALRARVALALIADGDRRAVVEASLAMALAALRAERAQWATALYEYCSGLRLAQKGRARAARGALERAVDSLRAMDMRAYERCALGAIAALDGAREDDASLAFFSAEGARDPRAMRRIFWPAGSR